MDDDSQSKSIINKPKAGNLSVHFTPKAPEPNTILGFFEDKIEISSFGGAKDDQKGGKGDQSKAVEKLRRTLVPVFSGGLPVNRISELNQFIEREL